MGGFGTPSSSSSSRRMGLGLCRGWMGRPGIVASSSSSRILLRVFDTDLQRHEIGAARRHLTSIGERLNGLESWLGGNTGGRVKDLL